MAAPDTLSAFVPQFFGGMMQVARVGVAFARCKP